MAECRLRSARRGPARCRAAAARGFSAWATRHYSRLSTPMRSWSPVRTCAGRLRRPSFLRSSRIASVTDRPCALRCNGCEPSDACMSFRTLLRSGRPMAGLDLWRCMPPQRRLSRRRHLQRAQRGDVRRSSRGCRRRAKRAASTASARTTQSEMTSRSDGREPTRTQQGLWGRVPTAVIGKQQWPLGPEVSRLVRCEPNLLRCLRAAK